MISRRMLRIKVIKALYAHMKSDADSLMASEKMLVTSIDKTYDLYFLLMSLVVEMAQYAEQRQEAAKNKKLPTYEDLNPNRKFVDNRVVQLIANSDSVNDYLASRKLSWAAYPELIKMLYTQLEQTEYFQTYMSQQERSFKELLKDTELRNLMNNIIEVQGRKLFLDAEKALGVSATSFMSATIVKDASFDKFTIFCSNNDRLSFSSTLSI